MITTSNFTMLTHIRHPLSIAMAAPRWYRGPVMKELAPSYNILKEYNLKGVIHCFSGSLEMANKFIKLGFKLGIGGVLTFKNCIKTRVVVL